MPNPEPGDFILCHRKGLASSIIRMGERLRFRSGARWSHVVFVVQAPESGTDPGGHSGWNSPGYVIEALTKGVVRTPLSDYDNIERQVVSTHLASTDRAQAIGFAQSCVGQKYGWTVIFACALRFLTPGRGLWFGMNGTEICSGLVAQCLVRGWANFKSNPSSLTPAELAEEYGVQSGSKP
jgi:uncharacterized protein YycO